MTAHLLRCVAESAATPAFGLSSADLVRSAPAATTTDSATSTGQPAAVASRAATTPASTPARDGDTVGHLSDAPAAKRDRHAADAAHALPEPVQVRRGHRLQSVGASRAADEEFTDEPLRPAFTSWSQMRMALVRWLAVVRTRCGLTTGDQYVLHLPCRDSGAIYRVPVVIVSVGHETRIVATSTTAPVHPHHADTWIADARAARFVVLARGSQQRIVELLSSSDSADSPDHLVLRPDRMHVSGSGHGDASVMAFASVPPAADVSAGLRASHAARRRQRSVAPVA